MGVVVDAGDVGDFEDDVDVRDLVKQCMGLLRGRRLRVKDPGQVQQTARVARDALGSGDD